MKIYVEGSGKPSDLNLKTTKKTIQKQYKNPALDTYDLRDYGDAGYVTRTEDDSTTVGTGYIKDKQGNQYAVTSSDWRDHTGSGGMGTTYYYVKIDYNGQVIKLKSYQAVMSSSTGYAIISALKDGMFLEDYLQKYMYDVEHDSRELANQIIQGNEFRDTTYKQDRAASYAAQYQDIDMTNFNNDYANWEIIENKGQFALRLVKGCRFQYSISYGKSEALDVEAGALLINPAISEYLNNSDDPAQFIGWIIRLKANFDCPYKYDRKKSTFLPKKPKQNGIRQLGLIQTPEGLTKKDFAAFISSEYDSMIGILNASKLIPQIAGGAIVSIVDDDGRLRAQANDGTNGPGWVTFPNELRVKGAKYRVDELIWNGKNYRVKGKPQLIS